MRAVLIIAVLAILVVGLLSLGWFYLRDTGDEMHIIIDKTKVEADTERALHQNLEAGKDLFEDATDGLEQLGDEVDSKVDQDPGPNDGASWAPATRIAA
jgi:hypothetical protein